ncbi:MAG: hypothetical protein OXD44_07850 [Gammaproteobacteria bacterium]|nr:hypothetical protein [Gammaproteobacteria bacterium]MCY4227609.1 hypothetical protein [Gammaproteobacteria bacterium]MCY4313588.1 hypothetical protein [Gammaproteobacteria bacterium]
MLQKARIRTAWKTHDRTVSISELANAFSAICWRIALSAAKNLHQQDFVYVNDEQRLAVIREYLFFQIHLSDRLVHEKFPEDDRNEFINSLSLNCLRHYAENTVELLDRQPDMEETVNALNHATNSLAGFKYVDQQPGYEMYRLLGSRIRDILGEDQTNKWVIDQIMEIDGPEIFDLFYKSCSKLVRNSGY